MAHELPIALEIGGLAFDQASYDAGGDVLYLHIGAPQAAQGGSQTPEGHVLRYDAEGRVIGLTIINARFLVERDDELVVTLPQRVQVAPDALASALAAA